MCQVGHICRCVSRSAQYIKVEYKDGASLVCLVASKTKVTPLQSITIPCLELMGAVQYWATGWPNHDQLQIHFLWKQNLWSSGLYYMTYGG